MGIIKVLWGFKEMFWDSFKDYLIFFVIIYVICGHIIPSIKNSGGTVSALLVSIIIVCFSIAFILDRFFWVGLLKEPKSLEES